MDVRDTMLYDLVVEEHRARLMQGRTARQLDALRDGETSEPGKLTGIGGWLRARFGRVDGHEASALKIAASHR